MRTIGITIVTLFLYCIGAIINYEDEYWNDTEENINLTIRSIEYLLVNGFYELPSLTPLEIPNYSSNFNNTLLSGHIKLKNLVLDEITDFETTNLCGEIIEMTDDGIKLKYDLEFTIINLNDIELKAEYDVDIQILSFISVHANGTLKANIKNLSISGKLLTSVDIYTEEFFSLKLQIEDINLDLVLDNSKLDLRSLIDDELINLYMPELIALITIEYKKEISKTLSDAAKKAILDESNFEEIFEIFTAYIPLQLTRSSTIYK